MNVGRKAALLLLAAASAVASVAGDTGVERIFREPRLTRGDTNVRRIQPIDDAAWIWDAQEGGFVKVFRCAFETKPGEGPIVIDVSADERFYLTVDGRFVARGPNRAQVENWQYQTYRLNLPPGRHEMRAVVTRVGDNAPRAQLSWRGGFILKAEGAFDGRLTTGRAPWQVGEFNGMRPIGTANGVFGTGAQFEIVGRGPFDAEPSAWRAPVVVREPVDDGAEWFGGHRSPGWMLYPSQLPDQIERRVAPGAFRAATHAEWRTNHVYTAEETAAPEVAAFNALLRGGRLVVPARTRLQLAWHLGRYVCAYPELVVARGKGSRVSWTWAESARDAATGRKGRRDEIVGKYLDGYGDVFLCDGGVGTFSSPWFRCGLWCRIDIETRDEPLEINAVSMVETRYPLEMESRFESPDDPTLADIRRISAHTIEMCCHEMLFDCPYYEQQMYPGDARLQMLVLSSMTRDDRMARRVMDIYALATHDDGLCPFNWPSRGLQEGFTYTLCYLLMYGDYAMNHADFAWLRSRLPDLRKSMSGCELYENADGLVEGVPGWNFMDWAVGWTDNGILPGTDGGRRPNAFVNLFWLLAIESAATTERALGNDMQAAYWEAKAVRLKQRIFERFWDEGRGMVADTLEKNSFSEHVQSLAIISDALPESVRATCFRHLVEDADLARTTVYFSYYLFEAYFKMERADLFLKRLDLWRDYVGRGMTTVLESPDSGVDGGPESRSDCHAWGAHPLWFMATGLAGIRSAAPGFARVCVAPQPGALTSLSVRHPHPLGWVEADLRFGGGRAEGIVRTPVPGVFRYGGRELPLAAGTNDISAISAQTEVNIDFSRAVGPVKPVNGVGQPPLTGALSSWSMLHYLKEAGIPYSRLHDVGGRLGGGLYVDIPNLFPDFDADEDDPKNYRFAFTDSLMKALVENGVEPFFRLGVSIENFVGEGYPRVNTCPPKDYAKWARICEHVIRHYTEGWADGFRMKVEYWEVWNEPENNPDERLNPMWGAPFSEFIRFYGVVAQHLKAKFPHLKIGGYGSCGFYSAVDSENVPDANSSPRMEYFVECSHKFLAAVRDNKWPLDFFSYHSYSNPTEAMRQVRFADRHLDEYGFTADRCERIFNEWLPYVGRDNLGSAMQAAGVAAGLVGLQNSRCDVACLYDARCGSGSFSPLFDPRTCEPRKAYYAFTAFNELCRRGTAVAVDVSGSTNLWVAAAKGGADAAVMMANDSDDAIPLSCDFHGGVVTACRITDGKRTDADVSMPAELPPRAFIVAILRL